MTISHLLEDFGGTPAPEPKPGTLMGEEELEDVRLGAFEQGYSAGWEDATAAQEKENQRLSAALAGNLEDMAFTYQEAVSQMTLALEPLFRTLIASFLPEAMARTLGDRILDELRRMARSQMQGPVSLSVPPGSAAAVRQLLAEQLPLPVEITEDAALDAGQVALRIDGAEREIDCAALLATFHEAIDAFFYQTSKEANNG